MNKELGKIKSVRFGIGGYQDAQIGVFFSLQIGHSSGVSDNRSGWDSNIIKCDERSQWTEVDRSETYNKIVRYVSDLLAAAKVDSIDDLVNIPIELTMDNMTLKSWRILTEVL